ncbi:MAG: ABC transporter substrate-binding protein [Defluviitaleaceae bacterium]|nr:ABC transporter substrate-binding protein [Defluviitaleaceae bacterium]
MKKYIFFLPFLFAVMLILSSCGGSFDDPPDPTPTPNPELPIPNYLDDPLPDSPDPRLPDPAVYASDRMDDGILRLPMRPPLTLNPLLNRDQTVARILALIFEPLAVLDENLRVTGHLAELDFAIDFSGVEVTIKYDAIWSDGLPVSSDDFTFSLDVLRHAPGDAIYRSTVENIGSVQRIDDRTVHVTFVDANPAAGYALLFPLIPRHYYRNETNPASLRNLSPLGNGPYLFERMIPLQSLTLLRNPNTFRTMPSIERVEVLFFPDRQIDLYAFDRGLVDAIRLSLPEWVRNPTAKEIHTAEFPVMYFEFVGFNFSREVFHDLDVRKGIAHAFDVNEAVATFYLQYAARAATPIHPHAWMHDPTALGLPHDPDRARLLLRDVPRDEEYPLIIIVSENSRERVAVAYRLADGLEEAGLTAEVHVLSDEEFIERLADNNDYDLFVGWAELGFVPDFAFLIDHDTALQELLAATRVAATESAYIEAVSQLQHAFIERVPVLGLAFRHSAVLMGTRIQSNIPPAPCRIFAYVNEWKIIPN